MDNLDIIRCIRNKTDVSKLPIFDVLRSKYCHGQCEWGFRTQPDLGDCFPKYYNHQKSVSCGGHRERSCAECSDPYGPISVAPDGKVRPTKTNQNQPKTTKTNQTNQNQLKPTKTNQNQPKSTKINRDQPKPTETNQTP